MLQCWAKMPTDRPTFEALKDFLAETVPVLVRAREALDEEGRMRVEVGDSIIVVDGRSENYWWKGQNQRTFQIGHFPRKIVQDCQGKKIKDISKPLKNSLIHTGHGSHNGKNWGRAEAIDDLYLRSPLQAPDMSGPVNGADLNAERRLPGRNSMKLAKNIQQPFPRDNAEPAHDSRPHVSREKDSDTSSQSRPHRPAPGWAGDRVQAHKSLPDLQKVYENQATNLHNREDSLIDLSPTIGVGGRLYQNTEEQPHCQSSASLLDDDIPPTQPADGGHYQYQNSNFNGHPEPHQPVFEESNTSFNSLPDGETYHLPPEEEDPFDTSNVVIGAETGAVARSSTSLSMNYSSNHLTYNQDSQTNYRNSFTAEDDDDRPSIISQLLASSSSQAVPPSTQISSTPNAKPNYLSTTPAPSASTANNSHKRAMSLSTTSEADLFLPPLTSPFSPPAFNPYELDLGSNEAIAGLDSPSPYVEKPKRQAQHSSREAFSWLNDKIGDMKISQNPEKNVFQFPTVGEGGGGAASKAPAEDLYATVKKKPKDHVSDAVVEAKISSTDNGDPTPSTRPEYSNNDISDVLRSGIDGSGNTQVSNLENYPIQQQQQQQKQLQQQQQRQLENQRLALHHQKMEEQRLMMLQQQQLQQQQLQQQRQLEQQQQLLQQQFQQQMIIDQREKEMERKNLEKIQLHKLEKERKRRAAAESQEQQLRRDQGGGGGGAGPDDSQLGIFHFNQFSTASTAGQSKETYAVDRNFIRDLEKNLGVDESKLYPYYSGLPFV